MREFQVSRGWGGARAGAGRPRGRWGGGVWRQALRIAAMRRGPDGVRSIQRMAEALVAAGIAGNIAAIREIGNRLDGKVRAARHTDLEGPARSFVVVQSKLSYRTKISGAGIT